MQLKTLNVCYNLLGNNYPGEGVKILAQVLKTMTNLEVLDLGSNYLGHSPEHAAEVAQSLSCLTKLKKLDLSDNCLSHFTYQTGVKFAAALRNLTELEELSISGDFWDTRDDGENAQAIASVLRALPRLKKLEMRSMYLKDPNSPATQALVPVFQELRSKNVVLDVLPLDKIV